MFTILAVLFLAAVGFGVYKLYKQYSAQKAVGGGSGVSAFARLAEADGKIIALKIAAKAKKEEALVQAAAVEEIHKILG